MKEIVGDLFASSKADAICITTNGFVKRDGTCVMGAGCAKEATKKWPGIEWSVGRALVADPRSVPCRLTYQNGGESPIMLPVRGGVVEVPYQIVTFPVKPVRCSWDSLLPKFRIGRERKVGETFPGWMSQAKLTIIETSARLLVEMAGSQKWESVVIPRPGCGAGGLKWEDVRPILSGILDDRFYMITFPPR